MAAQRFAVGGGPGFMLNETCGVRGDPENRATYLLGWVSILEF